MDNTKQNDKEEGFVEQRQKLGGRRKQLVKVWTIV